MTSLWVPQVYNLLVPALIETVDKLDLSTEPEITDEGDQVDEETEMDTFSETQVKVIHLVPSRLWYTHFRRQYLRVEALP